MNSRVIFSYKQLSYKYKKPFTLCYHCIYSTSRCLRRYRRNLKGLYVIHGSVWDRIVTWFFTLFSAASIKDQIRFLNGVQYLNDYISPDQLEIPPFVREFDIQVCLLTFSSPFPPCSAQFYLLYLQP